MALKPRTFRLVVLSVAVRDCMKIDTEIKGVDD